MDSKELRTTARLSLRRLATWLSAGAVLSLGSLTYCARTQQQAVQTPPAAPPEPPPPAATPITSIAPPSSVKGPPLPPLSLERFLPILARPELDKVAHAVETGTLSVAAQDLSRFLTEHPPAPAEAHRYYFLLARLEEQAGYPERALPAYTRAMQVDSPLWRYAKLRVARVLSKLGRPAEALEHLKAIAPEPPLAHEQRMLMAEAAFKTQNPSIGLAALRADLAAGGRARQQAETAIQLAQALLDYLPPENDPRRTQALLEVLDCARKAGSAARAFLEPARSLEGRARQLLPEVERTRAGALTASQRLATLRSLVDARLYRDAELLIQELRSELSQLPAENAERCEYQYLRAKLLLNQRALTEALVQVGTFLDECHSDTDLRAKLRYSTAKLLSTDPQRQMDAILQYEALEQEAPTHTLADDARLQAALLYLDSGIEARFTENLSSIADRYPNGDMTVEGLFRLALRRIDRQDWSGALLTLDRAIQLIGANDAGRGPDFAGRERYFRARALLALQRPAEATAELTRLVAEYPFSYYMLQGFTRLSELEPELALQVREEAQARARSEPFVIPARAEFSAPGFVRAMELLAVGEPESAAQELDALGFSDTRAAPEVLWGVALLYARAGAYQLSQNVARRRQGDYFARWPSGDWAEAWRLAFPRPYQPIVSREAKKNALPEALIYAVMREESAFDPNAESSAHAHGLMQLIVPTAKMIARSTGLPYDRNALRRPSINIALGSRALKKFEQSFESNPLLGIAAYNAGPGNPRRWMRDRPSSDFDVWVELIPFNETRRYVKRVLASRAVYAHLYHQDLALSHLKLPLRVAPDEGQGIAAVPVAVP